MTILESERLQIRGFRPGDWRDLREYVTLPEVTKYDYDYPSSEEDLKGMVEYFIETPGYWAVCLRASRKLILGGAVGAGAISAAEGDCAARGCDARTRVARTVCG
ncbi:MAG: GNAT family N-acetyltransferase [Anaerolineae bacterium]